MCVAALEDTAVTVSTWVPALALVIATLGWARLQVGAGEPVPVTAQVTFTVPVKPAAGVTLMVVIAELPLGTVMVPGAALRLKRAPPPPVNAAVLAVELVSPG